MLSEETTGVYGSPYMQVGNIFHTVYLCLSIPTGMTSEVRIHVNGKGPRIFPGDQIPIEQFEPKNVLGICDGSCREDHPGNLRQVRPLTVGVWAKIEKHEGFRQLLEDEIECKSGDCNCAMH